MITDLPLYVFVIFSGSVLFVLIQFYFASRKNWKLLLAILAWGSVHTILAISGFYDNTMTTPPRFALLIFPIVVILISSFFSAKMKTWLGSLNLKQFMYLHTVRIPVELTLYWLFAAGYVPGLMTFEGRNFDIIAGISAPIVAYFSFRDGKINRTLLYAWNIMSLILLTNILVNAVLSAPTILQQFAFDQPNVAVFHFPFILLPGIIVPLVLIANVASFVILKKTE